MSTALFDPVELKPLRDLCPDASTSALVTAGVDQYTQDWWTLRLGTPSASSIDNVVTNTGKKSAGAARKTYLCGLVAERLTRTVEMNHSTPAMERGSNLEPKARAWYEIDAGRDVLEVGFIFRDEKKDCGCSPDGICADRGLELKCPMRKQMINILLGEDVPTGYLGQCQFSMWVTGLPAWDFAVYTPEPEIPNRRWTIERDEKMMQAYTDYVPAFIAEIGEAVARVKEMREV